MGTLRYPVGRAHTTRLTKRTYFAPNRVPTRHASVHIPLTTHLGGSLGPSFHGNFIGVGPLQVFQAELAPSIEDVIMWYFGQEPSILLTVSLTINVADVHR